MITSPRIFVALLGAILVLGGCKQGASTAQVQQSPPFEATAALADEVEIEVIEEHWLDGAPRLRREVIRQEDGTLVDHGQYTRWHTNGRKEYEAVFIDGGKHGTTRRWHRNGQLWIEENYDQGKKDGVSTTWDENGAKRKEERFADGKPHGVWTVWTAEGKIKWQSEFNHGEPAP